MARLDHRHEIAAVVAVGVARIVVALRRARLERHHQRVVQASRVALGVAAAGALGEQVHIVIDGLEGDDRAYHREASPTARDRGDGGGAFDVRALPPRVARGPAQGRIRYPSGGPSPASQLQADDGIDDQPIAQRGADEHTGDRQALDRAVAGLWRRSVAGAAVVLARQLHRRRPWLPSWGHGTVVFACVLEPSWKLNLAENGKPRRGQCSGTLTPSG